MAEEGETDEAIQDLLAVKKEVSENNPVMPLLLFNLAGLYENRNELDKAMASLNELAVYKGFDAIAYKAMGRIYEQQGNNGEAVAMYQQYLTAAEKEDGPQGADPDREMIQARINFLQGVMKVIHSPAEMAAWARQQAAAGKDRPGADHGMFS